MNFNVSQNGLNLIKSFEGFRGSPYLDIVGVPTIGYGTTHYPNGIKVTLQDSDISETQGEQFLTAELFNFISGVNSLIHSSINQNQFDALLSFSYNLGVQSLRTSTLLKKINLDPSDATIKDEFLKWDHAGGKVSGGLLRRRQAEADLYFLPL